METKLHLTYCGMCLTALYFPSALPVAVLDYVSLTFILSSVLWLLPCVLIVVWDRRKGENEWMKQVSRFGAQHENNL